MPKKLLLVGESWVSAATHYKGFDQFGSVTFHLGAEPFVTALEASGFDAHLHAGARGGGELPLRRWRASPPTTRSSCPISAPIRCCCRPTSGSIRKTVPNRLKLIRDYVEEGGGLLMAGGYFSLPGHRRQGPLAPHAVEDTLPVTCLP